MNDNQTLNHNNNDINVKNIKDTIATNKVEHNTASSSTVEPTKIEKDTLNKTVNDNKQS